MAGLWTEQLVGKQWISNVIHFAQPARPWDGGIEGVSYLEEHSYASI